MKLLIKTAIYTLLFMAIARVLPNMFQIDTVVTAIIASFVLVLLNWSVKPLLHIISFPITFITFGLFSFVISAITLELTSMVMGSQHFNFNGFGSALVVAVILAICNSIINSFAMNNFQKRV
ncbi:phage holin family protein [Companilactobacillus ginsenosidimutans]|uniref:Membrane protein n=1 Tax=Companilactobacillus ginsenosidimutans TaxID=1007676 RepID=A0A0H4QN84_9LACO|nr:phage holin family protein [Companilactobacillus ginsenosidimutans]AKP68218.1 membrane protein [Companilactobacillus ginsenosidimutans]